MLKHVCKYGVPLRIHCDQGRSFACVIAGEHLRQQADVRKPSATRILMTIKLRKASFSIYAAIPRAKAISRMLGILVCTKFKRHQDRHELCIQLFRLMGMDPARECIEP